MRVDTYLEEDGRLFVHVNEEKGELAVWLHEPLGWWGSEFPSIASSTDDFDLDTVTTLVFYARREVMDGFKVVGQWDDVLWVDVGDVDAFIGRLTLDENGRTLRTIDEVGLITGPVSMIVLSDLSEYDY